METLPNELLMAIFGDFSDRNLLACRRTSSAWNRIILNLFSERFIVIISSSSLLEDCYVETFRELTQDKEVPTFQSFGKRIRFDNFHYPPTTLKVGPKRQKLEELERCDLPDLVTALWDVHTIHFNGVTNFWFLPFFLNNINRLESLTLDGYLNQNKLCDKGINADALQHLSSFTIFQCFLLNDKTLLGLTALMPNLAELNVATEDLVVYPGIVRRYYSNGVEDNPEEVILNPTTYKLTFAAVRAALKLHTTRLTTIRLRSQCLTYDSILELLENDNSLEDIYCVGKMIGDAKIGELMSDLKKKGESINKNIHYEFRERRNPVFVSAGGMYKQ